MASLRDLAGMARFGLVGLIATGCYLVTAIVLPLQSLVPVGPTQAALIASVLSVGVSYLGHHRVTFRKSGDHGFYLPRFVFVSVALSALAAGTTAVLTQGFGVSHTLVAVGVALIYPIASYLLNSAWVFRIGDAGPG